MRARDSKRLVIDADVAQASGSETATHPTSKNCRDFLMVVRTLNYHVVMSTEIRKEWNEHASNFARRWWVSMKMRNRVCPIDPLQDDKLCTKILCTARSERQIETMEKDFLLLNAALATDQTIISCEKRIRKLFARASKQVSEIQGIIWVNPDRTAEEQPIEWLKNGAPSEKYRQLSNFIPY